MRIIVTGGAGFIGSCVVRKAIAEGYAVLNIDALTYAASLDNIASVSSSQKYHFAKIDICNYDKLYKTIDSFQPDSNISQRNHM